VSEVVLASKYSYQCGIQHMSLLRPAEGIDGNSWDPHRPSTCLEELAAQLQTHSMQALLVCLSGTSQRMQPNTRLVSILPWRGEHYAPVCQWHVSSTYQRGPASLVCEDGVGSWASSSMVPSLVTLAELVSPPTAVQYLDKSAWVQGCSHLVNLRSPAVDSGQVKPTSLLKLFLLLREACLALSMSHSSKALQHQHQLMQCLGARTWWSASFCSSLGRMLPGLRGCAPSGSRRSVGWPWHNSSPPGHSGHGS
jgi:hypothetical protein